MGTRSDAGEGEKSAPALPDAALEGVCTLGYKPGGVTGLMAWTCLPPSHTNRGLCPRPGLSLALLHLPQ